MIGNDIVDLQEARQTNNWRRRGYLEKVFTVAERESIQQATDPDQWVWILWSAKESAYKLSIREGHPHQYAPKQWEVFAGERLSETMMQLKVQFWEDEYEIQSDLSGEWVHSIARPATLGWEGVCSGRVNFDDEPLANHREQLVRHLRSSLAIDGLHDWELMKDDKRVPYLLTEQGRLDVTLSISHHGRFGAYAWGRI